MKDDDLNQELITHENVSRDLLRAYFDQAFFNTALDDKGVLFVRDKFKVYIDISKTNTSITFSVCFRLKEDCSEEDKLDLTNIINSDLLQVKAILSGDLLTVEYDLWIEGGITVKNMMLAYRHFVSQTTAAIGKDRKQVFL